MKNKYGCILIKPQLGENIGATARVLKNFGFKKLYITSPRDGWPNLKAKATSVGASDILDSTKIYKTLDSLIKQFDLIFSFSARKRDVNKKHIRLDKLKRLLKKTHNKKIGLMFGPEASGLSNIDLSYSNYVVQIPSDNKFRSLNLSHSVCLVCYEIFKLNNENMINQKNFEKKLGKKGVINNFIKLLNLKLEKRNFYNQYEKKKSMVRNVNNLFYRLEADDKELRILSSIISALSKNS
tara:strand:+ start:256 stop:972 length:717 start_codon:yes stop_codon:yes gene_type:complete